MQTQQWEASIVRPGGAKAAVRCPELQGEELSRTWEGSRPPWEGDTGVVFMEEQD